MIGTAGGYPGVIVEEMLDEAGCDTLNLRILWQDKVTNILNVILLEADRYSNFTSSSLGIIML